MLAKTGRTQEPFVYGSLGGTNVALVSPRAGDTIEAGAVGSNAKAARDYELAAKVGTKEAWDAFLAAHPSGFHAELALALSEGRHCGAVGSASAAFALRSR